MSEKNRHIIEGSLQKITEKNAGSLAITAFQPFQKYTKCFCLMSYCQTKKHIFFIIVENCKHFDRKKC